METDISPCRTSIEREFTVHDNCKEQDNCNVAPHNQDNSMSRIGDKVERERESRGAGRERNKGRW